MIAHKEYKELKKIVDPRSERHPESAYQVSLSNLSARSWRNPYPECEIRKIQHINSKGVDFDLYESVTDRWKQSYVARDEFGETILDENGRSVSMSDEQKKEKINPRFSVEHFIVDRMSQEMVGRTSDEWGCLLIMVAGEYQRMGLGQALLRKQMEANPYRHTGGFTPSGQEAHFKAYQGIVARYMADGGYSRDVKSGKITAQKAIEIIKSAEVCKKHVLEKRQEIINEVGSEKWATESTPLYKRISKIDRDAQYDFSRGRMLVYSDANYAILFHEKALELFEPRAKDNYFRDRAILGYAYVGGVYDASSVPKLYGLFAANDKLKSLTVEIMLNIAVNEPMLLTKDQMSIVNNNPALSAAIEIQRKGSEYTQIELSRRTIPEISKLLFTSNALIKLKDPFEEAICCIHETAVQISDELSNKASENGLCFS